MIILGFHVRARRGTRARGNVTMEAEAGALQPRKPVEANNHSNWKTQRVDSPLESLGGAQPCCHLAFGLLASRTVRQWICCLSHLACGTFVIAALANYNRYLNGKISSKESMKTWKEDALVKSHYPRSLLNGSNKYLILESGIIYIIALQLTFIWTLTMSQNLY